MTDTASPQCADRRIGDYAFVSDCHSTALVSSDGSIDWACLRRFDHPSTFARLLDVRRGGHFAIRPTEPITSRTRRYVGATMILETTMHTATGTLVLTDAFAMRDGGAGDPNSTLMRRATCTAGRLELSVDVVARFDYGDIHPWLRHHDADLVTAVGGSDALVVHTTTPLVIDHADASANARIAMSAGDTFDVIAVAQPAHLLDPAAVDVHDLDRQLADTGAWWRRWSATTDVDGPYRDLVERSALVLKSLCCAPTGAIIAAPTTSLPEIPGGSKNWDYRFCWIRDSTLALASLADVGHLEVAQGFRDFVMRSSAGRGDELQIMYGPYGERRLDEIELGHLAGWRDSRPVRIGNGAADQTQLDVYGHLLDAAHLWHRQVAADTTESTGIDTDEWRFLASVVDRAADRHTEPDAGIWELRGPPRHHVHSKVMVWVALDRGIRLALDHGLDVAADRLTRWTAARDELRQSIETHGVDSDDGHFVAHYETSDVDASLLKLPLVGFVDAGDERMIATVDKIRRDLGGGSGGMLLRFLGDDDDASGDDESGRGRREGVFLLCSFWLVEVLAMQHRTDEATALFERLCSVANDVGLLAEEYDPSADELLGNFPQAFTHLGLIAAERRLRHPGDQDTRDHT